MLFVVLGWLEVHGIWALLVMAVLVVEVFITLVDFVEEDLSRKLPASERINHTLLALNYGAILALLEPVLAEWAGVPTALGFDSHGYWSLLVAAAAARRRRLRRCAIWQPRAARTGWATVRPTA